MNPKVEELLQKAREKEQATKEAANAEALKNRNAHLIKLGLYKKSDNPEHKTVVEVNYKDDYDFWRYNDNGDVVYYKRLAGEVEEISDEEYEQLLKYYPQTSNIQVEDNRNTVEDNRYTIEDNGEGVVMTIATISLIISIIGAFILFCIALSMGIGLCGLSEGAFIGIIMAAAVIVIVAFFGFSIIKVFVNISRKSTAIYQLLKEQKQSEK